MPRSRKDDTPRIFDVSKPHRTTPDPTARPIIVGHRPMMPDPMMTDRPLHHHSTEPAKVTSVPVKADDGAVLNGDSLPNLPETATHATPAMAALDTIGSTEPPTPGDLPESPLPAIEAAEAQQPSLPPILTQSPHEVSPKHPITPEPPDVPLTLEAPPAEPPTAPAETPPAQMTTPEIGQTPKPIHSTLATPPPVPAHPEATLDQSHLAGSLTASHSAGTGSRTGRHKLFIGLALLSVILASYVLAAIKAGWPLPFILG
jgi:hypothetical protein